jgi:hypothetical protein
MFCSGSVSGYRVDQDLTAYVDTDLGDIMQNLCTFDRLAACRCFRFSKARLVLIVPLAIQVDGCGFPVCD